MRLLMLLLAAASPVAAQTSSLAPAGPASPSLVKDTPVQPAPPSPVAPIATPGAPAPIAAAPAVAAIAPATTTGVLRSGTEVSLKTSEYLTTEQKQLRVGQRIRLEVADNVTLNGRIVIPAGSPAVAELTDVRNKGMWGKSGRFNGRVISVRVGERQIRLTGTFDDHGSTGTAGVVAAIAFVPIAGFLMTGTSAKMPLGTPVKAFLDEDLQILN